MSEFLTYSVFLLSFILLHIIYVIVFFEIVHINEDYVRLFNAFFQIFISILLLYKYHPFAKNNIPTFDNELIMLCASFLLINTIFTEIFTLVFHTTGDEFINSTRKYFFDIYNWIISFFPNNIII